MKSNQLLFIASLIVIGAWAIKAYAGTIQMNTFYPAPNGYYDNLTVKTKFLAPCYLSDPLNPPPGLVYGVDDTANGHPCPNGAIPPPVF